MVFPQPFVIGWIEYAVAGAILLLATKVIAGRLRQPVDRVNLIAMSLVASAFVPLLVSLASVPGWHLGLVSTDGKQVADSHAETAADVAIQPKFPESSATAMLPSEHLEQHDELNKQAAASATQADAALAASIVFGASNDSPSPSAASTINRFGPWSIAAAILLVIHALAMVFFILEWTIGNTRLRTILRKALSPDQPVFDLWMRVSDGLGGSVRLLVTNELNAPLVFGRLRPVVLIPESIARGDRSALQFCLAHEWSHVSSSDLRTWWLTNMCQFLLWYQPVFWLLRRELRICQDLVADDLAAGATGDHLNRIEYSELLMSIAKQAMSPRIAGAIAFYDHSSQLSRRIKTLLTSGQALRSRSPQAFYWMSGLLLLTASLLVGSVRLSTVQADEGAPNKPAVTQTGDANQSPNNKEIAANDVQMKVVRGRVINEAGEPVASAQLWLPLQYQPRRTVQATADDTGNFALKCPTDWISPRLSGSSWTIWAYAPGHSIQTHSAFEVVRGDGDKTYTIQLPPESNTRFKVLTPDGQPLPDVLVQPQNYKTTVGYAAVPEEMLSVVSARTDNNGLASLPAIQSGPLFRIQMTSKEFGSQSLRVDGSSDMPDREIDLRATATIKGQLVGENPEWVRGVKLTFMTDNQNEWVDPQGIAEVVTDDKGEFEVPVIASGGPLHTYVFLDPKLPVRPRLNDQLYLTAGETMQLEIPLVAAPLVHGKVVAKSSGEPVANAEISLGYGGFRQSDTVTTDKNGQYEGRVLPGPVRVQIIVLPKDFVQLGAPWAEPYPVPPHVLDFDLPTIEVVGTHEISGQLIGANDQPLANMQVMAVDMNRRYGSGKSGAEGRFRMRVPDGVETRIEVFLEDRGQEPVAVVQQDPLVVRYATDAREQEMESARLLRPDVSLIGRVLSSGEPVAGIPVLLKRGVPVFASDSIGKSPERKGTRYSQVGELKTDASGKYRLTGLKAGDGYQIEIRPPFPAADPNWHHQSPYIQNIPDDAKGEVALPDVKLLKLTQSIAGVVVDPDGKPVAGATVTVQLRTGEHLARMTSSGPPPWTVSDSKGRFQLKELPDEPLSIMAYFANPKGGRIRFPAKLDVDLNQQDIRIVLDPALREEEKN